MAALFHIYVKARMSAFHPGISANGCLTSLFANVWMIDFSISTGDKKRCSGTRVGLLTTMISSQVRGQSMPLGKFCPGKNAQATWSSTTWNFRFLDFLFPRMLFKLGNQFGLTFTIEMIKYLVWSLYIWYFPKCHCRITHRNQINCM